MRPTIIETILEKLSEQSTWRGLILLATACGLQLSPEHSAAIISVGLSIVGLINVIRKEPSK